MNIKHKLPEYFLEFIIIVFGISLSFMLNEWRKERDNNKAEIEALQAIHDDLVVDSTTIFNEAKTIQDYSGYYRYFLQNVNNKKANPDSIKNALNYFANYSTFEIRNVHFQQLQATGQLKLISNKKVLTEIINIYANQYSHIKEYIHIDRTMILEHVMPYMMKEAPISLISIYNKKNLLQSKEFKKLIKDSAFTNLFVVNIGFKSQIQARYKTLSTLIRKTLTEINAELERLK
ncbi:MAG: hypothetical protein D8M58_07950 [Calditrichaeota bacterium]|nr:MAG: hypothetical protein DWQ03_18540 [Calditrichota bacterium]MBL1205314.1 hypothetical protein [Calditrichota bacterium]NOG45143.1 hypothetical protein [Calditrichota bacterium]